MARPDYILRSDNITTALSQNGQTLITGTESGNIQVFDIDIMRPLSSWHAHKEFLTNTLAQVMKVSLLGDSVLSQGREGSLALWKDGMCVKTLEISSTGFCRFSCCNQQHSLYIGNDDKSKISQIDVDRFRAVHTFQPDDYKKKGLCWNLTQEKNHLFAGYESGHLVIFDKRNLSKQVLEVQVHDEIISAIDVEGDHIITSSPDGTIKVTNFTNGLISTNSDGREAEAMCAEVVNTIPLKCKGCSILKVRSDGKLFVAAGWDGGLRFYSWPKSKFLGLIEAHCPETVTDMYLSENRVVCSGRDKKISFWTMY